MTISKRKLSGCIAPILLLACWSFGLGQLYPRTLREEADDLIRETNALDRLVDTWEKEPLKALDKFTNPSGYLRDEIDRLRRRQREFNQKTQGVSYRQEYIYSVQKRREWEKKLKAPVEFWDVLSLHEKISEFDSSLSKLEAQVRLRLKQGELTEKERLDFAQDLSRTAASGAQLWNGFRRLSIGIDKIEGRRISLSQGRRGLANVASEEIAGLRDRLGLDIAKRRDGFSGVGVRRGKLKSLLDMGSAPKPTPESLARNSPLAWALKDSAEYLLNPAKIPPAPRKTDPLEEEKLKKIKLLRAMGLSRTVGDPAGRAQLVHEQSGNTCAICAQQQVISHYGLLPEETDPAVLEDKLFHQAVRNGFFLDWPAPIPARDHGGTPLAYCGSLLTLHGVPNIEHTNASATQLADSVKKGKMIVLPVHAGPLWNDPQNTIFWSDDGGPIYLDNHVVLITGAEVGRNGEVLGYYINDSASGEGARLVSRSLMQRAWASEKHYIETR